MTVLITRIQLINIMSAILPYVQCIITEADDCSGPKIIARANITNEPNCIIKVLLAFLRTHYSPIVFCRLV